jgi:hypothetical protein
MDSYKNYINDNDNFTKFMDDVLTTVEAITKDRHTFYKEDMLFLL